MEAVKHKLMLLPFVDFNALRVTGNVTLSQQVWGSKMAQVFTMLAKVSFLIYKKRSRYAAEEAADMLDVQVRATLKVLLCPLSCSDSFLSTMLGL